MNTICINSRDELHIIDLDLVACIKADGNYCNVMYMSGHKLMVSLSLVKFEKIIAGACSLRKAPNTFVRLGRSAVINSRYLCQILMQKQILVLSDRATHTYNLSVPKPLLKNYKEFIRERFEKKEV